MGEGMIAKQDTHTLGDQQSDHSITWAESNHTYNFCLNFTYSYLSKNIVEPGISYTKFEVTHHIPT